MKNLDEDMVLEYLRKLYGNSVFPGRDPNAPPDIYIIPSIGVEVTQLNQHFFGSGKPEGLGNLDHPLNEAFRDELESLNSKCISTRSYSVYLQYKRPRGDSMHQIRKDVKQALIDFLDSGISNLPYHKPINSEIMLSVYETRSTDGRVFVQAGSYDDDVGGAEISVYADNLRYLIAKKSDKIRGHLHEYNEWWLYLVDRIGFSLDTDAISQIIKLVGNTGTFDKLVLLSTDGQNVMATMSK